MNNKLYGTIVLCTMISAVSLPLCAMEQKKKRTFSNFLKEQSEKEKSANQGSSKEKKRRLVRNIIDLTQDDSPTHIQNSHAPQVNNFQFNGMFNMPQITNVISVGNSVGTGSSRVGQNQNKPQVNSYNFSGLINSPSIKNVFTPVQSSSSQSQNQKFSNMSLKEVADKLFEAIWEQDISAVRRIIRLCSGDAERAKLFMQKDVHKRTPLNIASGNWPEGAKLILDTLKQNVKKVLLERNSSYLRPLDQAICRKRNGVVKKIFLVCPEQDKFSVISAQNNLGNTSLLRVCNPSDHKIDYEILEEILNACPQCESFDFIKKQNCYKNTALHYVAKNGDAKAFKLILNCCSTDKEKQDLLLVKNKKNQTVADLINYKGNKEMKDLVVSLLPEQQSNVSIATSSSSVQSSNIGIITQSSTSQTAQQPNVSTTTSSSSVQPSNIGIIQSPTSGQQQFFNNQQESNAFIGKLDHLISVTKKHAKEARLFLSLRRYAQNKNDFDISYIRLQGCYSGFINFLGALRGSSLYSSLEQHQQSLSSVYAKFSVEKGALLDKLKVFAYRGLAISRARSLNNQSNLQSSSSSGVKKPVDQKKVKELLDAIKSLNPTCVDNFIHWNRLGNVDGLIDIFMAQDNNGYTPLFKAFEEMIASPNADCFKMMKLILDACPENKRRDLILVQNNAGYTILDGAIKEKNLKTVKLLFGVCSKEDQHFLVLHENKDGNTPSSLACDVQSLAIVKLIENIRKQ